MKRVLGFLTMVGGVAGAVWYARRQAGPEAAPADGGWAGRPNLRAVPDPARPDTAAVTAVADDLTEIKGIGPKYAEQLADLGLTTFAALAAADPTELAAQFEPRAAVADWITQARDRSPN